MCLVARSTRENDVQKETQKQRGDADYIVYLDLQVGQCGHICSLAE
jgi:hypothetical protein